MAGGLYQTDTGPVRVPWVLLTGLGVVALGAVGIWWYTHRPPSVGATTFEPVKGLDAVGREHARVSQTGAAQARTHPGRGGRVAGAR